VAEAEEHFFSWFFIESHTNQALLLRLRGALGMCPEHARRVIEADPGGLILTGVYADVLRGVPGFLRGDVRPATCPVCVLREQVRNQTCEVVLRGLADPELAAVYETHGGLCAFHAIGAVPHARAGTMDLIAAVLSHRLTGPRLGEMVRALDYDAARRHTLRPAAPAEESDAGPELPQAGSAEQMTARLAHPCCPICLAAARGERRFLSWLAQEHAAGDEPLSGRPGRLCSRHLHDLSLTDGAAGAKEAARSASSELAVLKRLMQRIGALPPPGVRARVEWLPGATTAARKVDSRSASAMRLLMEQARRSRRAELAAAWAQALQGRDCPACDAVAAIEGRQRELLATALASAPFASAYERAHGACLRCVLSLPAGPGAELAVRVAGERVAVLAWELQERRRKQAWMFRHEPGGPESDAWLRTLGQVDGRTFMGAPAQLAI